MRRISGFILLLIGIVEVIKCNRIESSSTPNDASVAVLDCNQRHPNVYFDVLRKEWMVYDGDTKCYQDTNELLNLCRAVYPGLSVKNVVRMNEPVKFTVYACSNEDYKSKTFSLEKNKGCSKILKRKVTPYKCLYGEYQAENLYIPPKCEFQHLITNDGCKSQDLLNLLAAEKCKSSMAALNSSLLLKWCEGVNTFTGIEFVCCPKTYLNYMANQQEKVFEDEDIDDDYDYINYDEYNDLYASEISSDQVLIGSEEKKINNLNENKLDSDFNKVSLTQMPENKKLNRMKSDMDKLDANQFIEYFNKVQAIIQAFDVKKEEESDLEAVEGSREQKEQYERQKSFIINSIKNSTENLIKEKQSTTAYLTEQKEDKNSIFYEPILRNLDDQYQVRFDRLEKEKERLLLQEEISYEQQVQGRLNEKKLNTVKVLNRIMKEEESKSIENTNLESIVKAMNEFLIAQENDRLHMVAVYKKLKAYFPEQVSERSQSIINHLDVIDKTIKETTDIFTAKFKLLSKCILPLLREHLKRYNQVREESKTIRSELIYLQSNHIKTDLRPTESPLINLGSNNDIVSGEQALNDNLNLNSKNTEFEYYDDDDISDEDMYDSNSEEDYKDEYQYSDEISDDVDDIDMKDDFNYDKINIKRLNGSNSNISTLFLMTAVLLGIVLSLILTYGLIKRKRSRSDSIVKHGFLPVDTMNPEDRHINAMQTNGYENPTYKYFESGSVQA